MNMAVKVRVMLVYLTGSESVAGLKTLLRSSTRSFIHSVSDVMIMCDYHGSCVFSCSRFRSCL